MNNNVSTNLFKKADFYISLFMYVFCGVVIWQIINTDIEGSRIMPIIVLIISLISATALLISTLRDKENVLAIGSLKFTRNELLMIVLLFVCYYLIRTFGFYTASFLLVVGVSIVLWNSIAIKDLLKILIYALVLIVLTYIVFNNFFGIIMPRGIFI